MHIMRANLVKKMLREYALVIVVIIVGLVGYGIFREKKHDILAASLDAVRDRLVAMIDDEASRRLVAVRFDRFKERVLANEVPPDEVANVAANVLNLSNSGSTITPEQADLILNFAALAPEATLLPEAERPAPEENEAVDGGEADPAVASAAPAPTPAPVPGVPASPIASARSKPAAPAALNTLGERLESMLAFDGEVRKALAIRTTQRPELARHIRYRYDMEGGLQVDLDAEVAETVKRELTRQARQLERRQMVVVWKHNMEAALQAEREHARRALQSLAALRQRPQGVGVTVTAQVEALESLKRLETLGYRPMLPDSVQHRIKVYLEVVLEAAEAQSEAAQEAHEAATEAQLEALEAYLEEIEDSLEALEEAEEERDESEKDHEGGARGQAR